MQPADLKYTKDHEWVKLDDSVATMGITDFAQQELGDIVFVELPNVGDSFQRGDVLGTIESVKAVSDIFAPLSGKVVAVNDGLTDKPETVNSDAFGEGWYCKIEVGESGELADLLAPDAYQQLLG